MTVQAILLRKAGQQPLANGTGGAHHGNADRVGLIHGRIIDRLGPPPGRIFG